MNHDYGHDSLLDFNFSWCVCLEILRHSSECSNLIESSSTLLVFYPQTLGHKEKIENLEFTKLIPQNPKDAFHESLRTLVS